jgi:hypothetical protein
LKIFVELSRPAEFKSFIKIAEEPRNVLYTIVWLGASGRANLIDLLLQPVLAGKQGAVDCMAPEGLPRRIMGQPGGVSARNSNMQT